MEQQYGTGCNSLPNLSILRSSRSVIICSWLSLRCPRVCGFDFGLPFALEKAFPTCLLKFDFWWLHLQPTTNNKQLPLQAEFVRTSSRTLCRFWTAERVDQVLEIRGEDSCHRATADWSKRVVHGPTQGGVCVSLSNAEMLKC